MLTRTTTALFLLLCSSLALAAEMDEHPYDSPNLFGRPVWIGEGEARFPALLGEAAVPESRGLVILLHAEGEHPEWPRVIQGLRQDLTDHEWTTLALQLPIPDAGNTDFDADALAAQMKRRLQMALDYAVEMDPPLLILIGHSSAASVALDYARQHNDPPLMAVVGISMRANPHESDVLNSATSLRELELPILDIYAERDRLEVLNSLQRRDRAARRAGNDDYRQLVIPGADHHFYNHDTLLNKRVRSWLDARYKQLKLEQLVKSKHTIEDTSQVELPPAEPEPAPRTIIDEMNDLAEEMPPSLQEMPDMMQEREMNNPEGSAGSKPESQQTEPPATSPTGPGGLF
ncbi:MAG: DUF3530 family protein [Gammaproteobacteria bacterium]|nr:DUF3530 family protein [Gammaproteobacteria bacterium]